jgi:hypothetical protein
MNLAEVVIGNSRVQIVGRNAPDKMADHSISGTMNRKKCTGQNGRSFHKWSNEQEEMHRTKWQIIPQVVQ